VEEPTEYPDPKSRLVRAQRIGLIGDIHGDLGHLLIELRMFRNRGIDTIVQLGDFGMVWPQAGWVRDLSKLDRTLARLDQTLYWLDGNHEDHRRLAQWSVSPDGIRWIRDSIGHLPRGFRTVLASGKTLAVLGGANSIDFGVRTEGISFWPEESITDVDLEQLGHEPADVLLGHALVRGWDRLRGRRPGDVPSGLPAGQTGSVRVGALSLPRRRNPHLRQLRRAVHQPDRRP